MLLEFSLGNERAYRRGRILDRASCAFGIAFLVSFLSVMGIGIASNAMRHNIISCQALIACEVLISTLFIAGVASLAACHAVFSKVEKEDKAVLKSVARSFESFYGIKMGR